MDGKESCDYSLLTASEVIALKVREQRRNLMACRTGYGYCDLSRLTKKEARTIVAESPPALR
jgi:hypothetical protein